MFAETHLRDDGVSKAGRNLQALGVDDLRTSGNLLRRRQNRYLPIFRPWMTSVPSSIVEPAASRVRVVMVVCPGSRD